MFWRMNEVFDGWKGQFHFLAREVPQYGRLVAHNILDVIKYNVKKSPHKCKYSIAVFIVRLLSSFDEMRCK